MSLIQDWKPFKFTLHGSFSQSFHHIFSQHDYTLKAFWVTIAGNVRGHFSFIHENVTQKELLVVQKGSICINHLCLQRRFVPFLKFDQGPQNSIRWPQTSIPQCSLCSNPSVSLLWFSEIFSLLCVRAAIPHVIRFVLNKYLLWHYWTAEDFLFYFCSTVNGLTVLSKVQS